MMNLQKLKKYFKHHKKLFILIIAPLFASIFLFWFQSKAGNCAFVLTVMSLYWTTECLPIAITSLIPIVLFPILGIMSSKNVTKIYFQDIIILFYGGLVMANAIEMSGLHERLALKILLLFGSNPKWLMFGFMIVTAFMSLWISNAASCSMMLPIINAIVMQLIIAEQNYINSTSKKNGTDNKALSISTVDLEKPDPNNLIDISKLTQNEIFKASTRARNLSTGFLLSCAYSSTIGGIGSLVGTAPNVLLKGFIDEKYPNVGLNFFSFSLVSLPVSIILLVISWLWLTFKWLPREYLFNQRTKNNSDQNVQDISNVIRDKYENLGPTTFQQKCVGIIFIILVMLWLTRDIQGLYGWGLLFKPKFVSDATPAVLAVFFLFACPKNNIFKGEHYIHLMDWKRLQAIFPWNVVLLIGGGLAIAEGFQNSGLSNIIGEFMMTIMSPKKEITLIAIMIICASATELTSNTSISSIFIPIVDSIAKEMEISPIYLLLPLILSVSLAFMFPIAAPNNAIIFATGTVRIKDMIKTGLVMNIIGLSTIYIAANTWLKIVFDVNSFELKTNSSFFSNKTKNLF